MPELPLLPLRSEIPLPGSEVTIRPLRDVDRALAARVGAGARIAAVTQADWRTEEPLRWELLDVGAAGWAEPGEGGLLRVLPDTRIALDDVVAEADGALTASWEPLPDTGTAPDETLRRELHALANRARRQPRTFEDDVRIPRPEGELTAWVDAVAAGLSEHLPAGRRYDLLTARDPDFRARTLKQVLREALGEA